MSLTPAEIARANLQAAITAWTPGIQPTWTIAQVRHALRTHREGSFAESAQLVDSMGEDDCIPELASKRIDALLQSDFELQPVDAPNRTLSERIAEQLGPLWWDYFPEGELFDFLHWYLHLGVGVATFDWTRSASRWSPRLRTLPPHFLRFDEHRKAWLYNAREGELEVTPGDGRWFLLTRGQRGWMHGLVRRLAVAWVAKQLTIRDWNRYNERHGLPIIKAMAPAIADEEDKDQFWEDMESLGQEAVAQLPTHLDDNGAKFDLDLLEAKDQSWRSFEAQLDRCDRRFTVVFLGGNLSTEVASTGANRAAATTHDDQLAKKATADEKRLSTEARRQGLWPIAALNVPGATFESTPWPHWQTEPPEDATQRATGQKTFGEAVQAVEGAGYEIQNIDELGEKHGLKLKKVEKPQPPAPPGVPPPTPPPPGDPPADNRHRPPFAARLASGDALEGAQGFLDGQGYVSAVEEYAVAHARKALRPTLDAIAEQLDQASDFDDLRARLRALYTDLSPEELSELVYRAMALGEFAGRHATNQDA